MLQAALHSGAARRHCVFEVFARRLPEGRRYGVVAGTGRRQGTAIFVSRGVGTVYIPVRLNCPPEAAVLTLLPVRPES